MKKADKLKWNENKGYNVVFISSSSRYDIPEKRAVYKKKFKALSDLGNISYIAVSESGAAKCGKSDGAELCLSARTGFKPLDLLLFQFSAIKNGLKQSKGRESIIYSQSALNDGVAACMIKGLTGAKLIVGLHGDWETEINYSKPRTSLFMPLINAVAANVFKKSDAVRVISDATEERALEFVGKDKIFSVKFPALFDINFFLEGEVKEFKENSAVFVGSLIGRKGIAFLIRAVPLVKKKFPDFKVYILGKGPIKEELETLAKKLKIENNVEFLGHRNAEDVKKYIDKSSVLVLPSLSEGLGRIALEAMARGRPVIGSATEGIKETVRDGENGYLVEPRNYNAIAEGIIRILQNKKKAQEMGKQGRAWVKKNFSMKKYVENHKKLFDFALSK
jgi:glycosyltransferase involved in cell wall biosynthesis